MRVIDWRLVLIGGTIFTGSGVLMLIAITLAVVSK